MRDFIEKLKASKNIFLKVEGEAIEKWKKLPHNKKGLDVFLKFNIAEIQYDGVNYFCTSNTDLINRLLKVLQIEETANVEKLNRFSFVSMRNIVLTWNLIDDKMMSMSMKKEWQITNFIPIDSSNVELLNSIINDLLKRDEKKAK